MEDPAVAIGQLVQLVVTAGAFAFSVWLLLSQYQAAHPIYVVYVFIAAAAPVVFFLLGGKVKEWISAYESSRGDIPVTGLFGSELYSEGKGPQQVHSAR